MSVPLFIVDAFTDPPFAGNPAAVCLLADEPADEWMQQTAAELNKEMAFLWPERGGYRLRWFTPAFEVELCGHTTLASAHVLWETGRLRPGAAARFFTRSGLLTAECGPHGPTLDLPARPPDAWPLWQDLPALLGVRATFLGKIGLDCLVEVESEQTVCSLRPDFARLARYPVRGIIVTARARQQPYDFVSRFFAPRAGLPEDPVTGCAHCCLGPYWGDRLRKRDLVGYQASARGGLVRVGVRDDRVHLGGRTVTVLRGEWCG
jgi:predicted PhzF superfamily epimerase YddE/YHI9